MMEAFDDEMFPDRMTVYTLVTVEDSENVPASVDGPPAEAEPVPCVVIDPTLATAPAPGVEPGGRDTITIYAPRDPGVDRVNQLVEILGREGVPAKRIRTTGAARRPVNLVPYWVVVGQWIAG